MKHIDCIRSLAAAVAIGATTGWGGEIAILPSESILDGPEGRQHLLVVGKEGDLFAGEIEGVKITSSNPDIITIAESEIGLPVAVPKKNGTVTITAKSPAGETATAKIEVKNFEKEHNWSFTNHVLPVLSRQGCNTGGCHGAIAGKGGFRLSLNGYDPPGDFYTMTREMRGRRIEMADPARSLILTKPTQATPHKGGRRLDATSRDYRVLAEWVTNGAAPPSDEEPEVEQIEVLPAESLLKPGQSQRLVVLAHYSDGSVEDVTTWARFTATDETAASVDEAGTVSVIGHGQGAVVAWFSSKIVLARITSPYPNEIPDSIFTDAPKANFIDETVLAQLRQLNLKPSPRTADEQFVRRVFIDTIGKLPTVEETRKFIEDTDPGKRTKLVDDLLGREEFVDYWAYRFSDILLVNGKTLRPGQVKA
ncbi:MAG: DUF1549 domain-containing protein, partial [Verrucomicrobiales bacterium]|nr:DUF1549 domain-containing protein [Verrucomicrobiales bacterium]